VKGVNAQDKQGPAKGEVRELIPASFLFLGSTDFSPQPLSQQLQSKQRNFSFL
jgi:hypothetical protein